MLDRLPEARSGEIASPRDVVLHGTNIVLSRTLRKHYCYMDANTVRGRTFGGWLQYQLDRRDWSKADFANRLGVANGDVSRWVNNKRIPSPASCDRIADVLGVDVDVVLVQAGHRPPDIEVDPDSATARLMPLIEQIDWDSRPGRIEEMEAELRFMIDVDRMKAQRKP
jgi:transcriptional regulator with XRE-family HTH domain